RHAQQRRLRRCYKFPVLARCLIAGAAMRARIIGGKEGADDELARLDCSDRAADLLNDSAIFMPHRCRTVDRVQSAVGPQIGPADAGCRRPDDCIRRLDNLRRAAFLKAYVAGSVENCAFHALSYLPRGSISRVTFRTRAACKARPTSLGCPACRLSPSSPGT